MRQAPATSRREKSADDINSWMARRWADLERHELGAPSSEHEFDGRARLGGQPYPRSFVESEFNKIRHEGVTTRDVYRNHIGNDDHYFGGKAGGVPWSGLRDLGWTRYGPIDRLYYGTSPYTQAAIGPVLLGGTIVDAGREEAGQ